MSSSITLLVATMFAAAYGLFVGNFELFCFAIVVAFLKYKEESKHN